MAVPLALAAAISPIQNYYGYGRGMERRLRRLFPHDRHAPLSGAHVLEILPDGILVRYPVMESKTLWAGLKQVVSTPTHTFIYVGSLNAYILPRSGVLEGNYDEFVRTLQDRLAAARAAASAP